MLYIVALPLLVVLSFKKKYKNSIPARFFLYKNPPFKQKRHYFHSCSLGETRAIKPLIKEAINLSVITNTGYEEAKKYNADGKIIRFLEKFGEKANIFLEKHWGKLLVSGFVLLNADDIIQSMENVAKTGVKEGGEVVTKSVDSIVNSQFGLLAGIALILFAIFKFGIDFFMRIRRK